jgi:hypothetical protein
MILQEHHEDCPECGSENIRLFHSHYCQAFIIICDDCKHEAGCERHEYQAWRVWDDEALKAKSEKQGKNHG